MPISFERIPNNIRVPLFYAEVSSREAAYFQILQPTLILGPMLATGSGNPYEPVLLTDASQAYGLFGAGSIIGDMVQIYRRNDVYGTVWAIGVPVPATATPAELSDLFAGTATAAGTVALYVGGDRYAITIAAGDTAEQVALKVVNAVNAEPFSMIDARFNPATPEEVTFSSKAAGGLGNDLLRVWNWRGLSAGEFFPPGITVTEGGTSLSGGAGAIDFGPIVAAMGDDDYDFIVTPWTDTASLNALQEAMNDVAGRWAWSRQIYGHVFGARMDTLQDLVDFGRTRNDPHCSIMGYALSPSAPWRHAAAFAGQAAVSLRNDPARPLQTLGLQGVLPPLRGHRFTIGDSNTLLYNGIATEMEVAGQVQIQRACTTYRMNMWGQADPSWLDIQTPYTLAYLIRFLRQRILTKFPRHKLADDGTPLGFGQAVVTPRIIRAELVAAYSELISVGLMENMDAFKHFLIVERDQNDPNRVNVLLPPDLVNQLRIFAMLVEFRLHYAPSALTATAGVAGFAGAAGAVAATPLTAPAPAPMPGAVPVVPTIAPFA